MRQNQSPADIKGALIGAIAAIIAAFIIGIFTLLAYRQSLSPTNVPSTPVIATSTVTSQPTSSTTFAFDFETSTQNWGTSEGAFKLAKVDLTNNPVHSGTHALRVTTAFLVQNHAAFSGMAR